MISQIKDLWLLTEKVEETTRDSEICKSPTVWAVFELFKCCPFLFCKNYTATGKTNQEVYLLWDSKQTLKSHKNV